MTDYNWKAVKPMAGTQWLVVEIDRFGDMLDTVAVVEPSPSRAEVDDAKERARLMAAAPDLLSALQKLDSIERGMQGWHEDARAEAWADARAAIAKATGGEQ